MVTLAEYEKVQDILKRQGVAQPKRQVFAYTGLIRCGKCGCMVTAEMQKGHVYYHCTNSRGNCTKRGVRQEELDRQIRMELRSVSLQPDIENMLLATIDRFESAPMLELHAQYKQVSSQLVSCEQELGELIMMRARRLIDDLALASSQDRIKGEIMALRKSQATLQTQLDAKHDSVSNAVHFATHAVERFNEADVWAKRRIVQVLGGSYVLNDKVLHLEKHPLLHFIAENKEAIERAVIGSEKAKTGSFQPAVASGRTDGTLTELLRLSMLHPFARPMWAVA